MPTEVFSFKSYTIHSQILSHSLCFRSLYTLFNAAMFLSRAVLYLFIVLCTELTWRKRKTNKENIHMNKYMYICKFTFPFGRFSFSAYFFHLIPLTLMAKVRRFAVIFSWFLFLHTFFVFFIFYNFYFYTFHLFSALFNATFTPLALS